MFFHKGLKYLSEQKYTYYTKNIEECLQQHLSLLKDPIVNKINLEHLPPPYKKSFQTSRINYIQPFSNIFETSSVFNYDKQIFVEFNQKLTECEYFLNQRIQNYKIHKNPYANEVELLLKVFKLNIPSYKADLESCIQFFASYQNGGMLYPHLVKDIAYFQSQEAIDYFNHLMIQAENSEDSIKFVVCSVFMSEFIAHGFKMRGNPNVIQSPTHLKTFAKALQDKGYAYQQPTKIQDKLVLQSYNMISSFFKHQDPSDNPFGHLILLKDYVINQNVPQDPKDKEELITMLQNSFFLTQNHTRFLSVALLLASGILLLFPSTTPLFPVVFLCLIVLSISFDMQWEANNLGYKL